MSRSASDILAGYSVSRLRYETQLRILEDLQALSERTSVAAPDVSPALQTQVKPLEEKLSAELRQLCAELELAQELLRQVESTVHREILERRYFQQMDFSDIAAVMHYSERHIRRLHKDAMDALILPENLL